MPLLTRCSSCSRSLRVPDHLLGKKVKCPACGVLFVAAEEEAAAPTPPPEPAPAEDEAPIHQRHPGAEPDQDDPEADARRSRAIKKRRRDRQHVADARARMQAPGICLLVTNILNVLTALALLVWTIVGYVQAVPALEKVKQETFEKARRENPGNPDQRAAEEVVSSMFTGALTGFYGSWACYSLLSVAAGGLGIFAGVRMMQARSRTLVRWGTILSMIPCVSPCFLLGIPVGIWCLVTPWAGRM